MLRLNVSKVLPLYRVGSREMYPSTKTDVAEVLNVEIFTTKAILLICYGYVAYIG